jgi:hypothetical protein
MKCPFCHEELVKVEVSTHLGKAEFYVCPSGNHYFIKVNEKASSN